MISLFRKKTKPLCQPNQTKPYVPNPNQLGSAKGILSPLVVVLHDIQRPSVAHIHNRIHVLEKKSLKFILDGLKRLLFHFPREKGQIKDAFAPSKN